ncbi:hypothetical protein J8273_4380 [Carpediemonas membranifera]|uniref:Uncharacterized protein n=1 Tax=Carpediemonas membranifera TaxID=201153 RepID=A0A8J6B2E6_9EUKA|nr:hypothetical protein J8273_4380 [Carpediemonas membranifera]|eukprot:KAG9394278.1 hypothetical protein J8273_4380 [Carpediemonas membranifera]
MSGPEAFEEESAAPDRIIELSKANRALRLELNSSQEHTRKLKKELEELKEKQSKMPAASPAIPSPAKIKGAPADEKKMMAHFTKRVGALEASNTKLKAELAKYRQALIKELGDEQWDPQELLDGASNWRGRATQIALLKVQLKEARTKIGERSDAKSDVDVKNKHHLDQMRESLHQKVAELEEQLLVQGDNNSKLRRHNDSLSSRVGYLEKQSADLRNKLKMMVQKAKHDDELISSLRQKESSDALPRPKFSQESMPRTLTPPTPQIAQSQLVSTSGAQEEHASSSQELEECAARIRELEGELDERGEMISALQDKLARANQAGASEHQTKALASEVARLEELLASTKRHNADLSSQLEEAVAQRQQLQLEVNKANAVNAKLMQEKPEGSGDLDDAAQLRIELESAKQQAEARVRALKNELVAKEDEVRLSKQLLEDNKAAYDSALGELVAKMREERG